MLLEGGAGEGGGWRLQLCEGLDEEGDGVGGLLLHQVRHQRLQQQMLGVVEMCLNQFDGREA